MYAEALQFYEKAQIEALEEKHLPPRSLKVSGNISFKIERN
jgi:hypothetical protein